MSVKRVKDPAGLLPDRMRVDLDGPHADDVAAVVGILDAASPSGRIGRLRRHESLKEQADDLAADLEALGGTMDDRFHLRLTHAETRALYLDAAPASITKQNRIRAARRVTDADIDAALEKHNTQKEAAIALNITERQLRNRTKNRKS